MGIEVPEAHLEAVKETLRRQSGHTPRSRAPKAEASLIEGEFGVDFAFIAGHTSGGAPFGMTWEEMDEVEGGPGEGPDPSGPCPPEEVSPQG